MRASVAFMGGAQNFRRIFVANRGEVAERVARTCDLMGITPVFGVSAADQRAPWVRDRECVVLGPARSSESYLDVERVVQAARQSRCSAVHPGWGFLSENPLFAAMCEQHGMRFIGPPASVMELMGQKIPAKRAMAASGLQVIPGSPGGLRDVEHASEVAEEVGYPVLLKAERGGGGRGMRIARAPDQLQGAYAEASAEALACFGDGRLYLEKLVEGGRHIEIQLLGDRYGNVVHFGERDCTIQRNHQKLLEESPSPVLDAAERERTFDAAVRATARIGYVGAGTMEFLLDADGVLRFMEMNTRLQVEHSVSEERTGIDLVRAQIEVAAGQPLSMTQADIPLRGHAIECRINAEDPADEFRPSPGVITSWEVPVGEGIRVDTHVESGYEVPPHYDSLICKIITHGETRDVARERMIGALDALVCEGIPTTASMHRKILSSEAFRASEYNTGGIPGWEGGG